MTSDIVRKMAGRYAFNSYSPYFTQNRRMTAWLDQSLNEPCSASANGETMYSRAVRSPVAITTSTCIPATSFSRERSSIVASDRLIRPRK